MAAAALLDHAIIEPVETLNNTTERIDAQPEKAGQQYLEGVPVMLDATGLVIEWDGVSFVGGVGTGIAGVSRQPGANLPSDGAGAPTKPYGSVGFPGTSSTFGSVGFQPAAVNIAEGAPMSDGRAEFAVASHDTIFKGQVDNSAGAIPADYTPTQAMIGQEFGLTKDADGHWYVDLGKTTVGVDTAVILEDLDYLTGSVPNAMVLFRFKDAISQFEH